MHIPILGSVQPELVAISIPIIAVCGGVFIAITGIIMGGRRKELEHRERIIAMEKGLAIPADVPEPDRPKYSGRRANGLVLTGIGIALTIAMWLEDGRDTGAWGLIPLFIGVGLLIAAHIDKREWDEERARNRTPQG